MNELHIISRYISNKLSTPLGVDELHIINYPLTS